MVYAILGECNCRMRQKGMRCEGYEREDRWDEKVLKGKGS